MYIYEYIYIYIYIYIYSTIIITLLFLRLFCCISGRIPNIQKITGFQISGVLFSGTGSGPDIQKWQYPALDISLSRYPVQPYQYDITSQTHTGRNSQIIWFGNLLNCVMQNNTLVFSCICLKCYGSEFFRISDLDSNPDLYTLYSAPHQLRKSASLPLFPEEHLSSVVRSVIKLLCTGCLTNLVKLLGGCLSIECCICKLSVRRIASPQKV